jgi:hypothetical protein
MSNLLEQPLFEERAFSVIGSPYGALLKCARPAAFPVRADLSEFASAQPATADPRSLTQEDAFAKAMSDRRLASSFLSAIEGKATTVKLVGEPASFMPEKLMKRALLASAALGKRFWAMEANRDDNANLIERKILLTSAFFSSLGADACQQGELPKFTFISVNLNNREAKELVERASKTCFHGKSLSKYIEWIDINLNLIRLIPEFKDSSSEPKAQVKPALKALLLGFLYADNPDLYLEMCRRFDDRKTFRLAMCLVEAASAL